MSQAQGRPPAGSPRSPPLGGRHDGVHHLDDAVQGRVRADGHVGAAEVVVDGSHHPHHVEVPVLLHLLRADLACGGTSRTPRMTRGGGWNARFDTGFLPTVSDLYATRSCILTERKATQRWSWGQDRSSHLTPRQEHRPRCKN